MDVVAANQQNLASSSPFQATKLWNQLVESFKKNIELKKKRWKMKTYEDCFSGSEALTAILKILEKNPRFDQEITRQQACLLLQKFLESNIIKDIRDKVQPSFEADSHLYRLQNSKKDNLEKIDKRDSLADDLVKQQIGQYENKGDQKAYFGSKNLRSSKRKPFVSLTNLGYSPYDKPTTLKRQSIKSLNEAEQEVLPFTLNNIPKTNHLQLEDTHNEKLQNDALYNDMETHIPLCKSTSLTFQRQGAIRMKRNGKFPIYDDQDKLTATTHSSHYDDMHIDTSKEPKVRKRRRSRSFGGIDVYVSPTKQQRGYSNAKSYVNYAVIASAFEKMNAQDKSSFSDMKTPVGKFLNPKEVSVSNDELQDAWKTVSINSLKNIIGEEISIQTGFASVDGRDVQANGNVDKKQVSQCVPEWLLSAMKCLIRWPETQLDQSSKLPSYPGFESDVFNAIKEHYDSMMKAPLIPMYLKPLLDSLIDMIDDEWLRAVAVLKYICILIPHENRLNLQLLTRFINKLSRNDSIQLSLILLNKELLVQTFHHLIFVFNDGNTDIEGIKLFTFMLDNSEEIFKLPRGLRFQVDHKLAVTHGSLTNLEINVQKKEEQPVTFCRQVSPEQHEAEAQIATRKAMMELLDRFLNDKTISAREKRSFVRRFKKTYPDLYSLRVPQDDFSRGSRTSLNSLKLTKW